MKTKNTFILFLFIILLSCTKSDTEDLLNIMDKFYAKYFVEEKECDCPLLNMMQKYKSESVEKASSILDIGGGGYISLEVDLKKILLPVNTETGMDMSGKQQFIFDKFTLLYPISGGKTQEALERFAYLMCFKKCMDIMDINDDFIGDMQKTFEKALPLLFEENATHKEKVTTLNSENRKHMYMDYRIVQINDMKNELCRIKASSRNQVFFQSLIDNWINLRDASLEQIDNYKSLPYNQFTEKVDESLYELYDAKMRIINSTVL